MPSSPLDTIAALRALHRAADRGEWVVVTEDRTAEKLGHHHSIRQTGQPLCNHGVAEMAGWAPTSSNAASIVGIHNAAPALLALAERAALVDAVRERWGNPVLTASPFHNKDGPVQWVVWGAEDEQGRVISGSTEEAAWRAALDAAPKGGSDAG